MVRAAPPLRLACLLSDGDGLRQALDWKGSSSFKPCFVHDNILKKDSDLAHRRPGFFEITSVQADRFRTRTSAEAYAAVDVLLVPRRICVAGDVGVFWRLGEDCFIYWHKFDPHTCPGEFLRRQMQ